MDDSSSDSDYIISNEDYSRKSSSLNLCKKPKYSYSY